MDRRTQAKAERDGECDDAGELKSLAEKPQQRTRQYHWEDSRQNTGKPDHDRTKCEPDKDRNQAKFDGEAVVEFFNHARTVTRGDSGQTRDRDLVTWMRASYRIQCGVELVHHGQKLAGIAVRHPPRYQHRVTVRIDKTAAQMFGDQIYIFLEGRDIIAARFFRQPAAQRLDRPNIANTRLLFD